MTEEEIGVYFYIGFLFGLIVIDKEEMDDGYYSEVSLYIPFFKLSYSRLDEK